MDPRRRLWVRLAVIVGVTGFLLWLVLPYGPNINWGVLGIKPGDGQTESDLIKRIDFRLGLDLRGGAELRYHADLSTIGPAEHRNSMEGIRDVIERRINALGVSEPVIQVQGTDQLVVQLPGVANPEDAIKAIGKTPTLMFLAESAEPAVTPQLTDESGNPITSTITDENGNPIDLNALTQPQFEPTELTGRNLKSAQVSFSQSGLMEPQVQLVFDDEGARIFEQLTGDNIGKRLAIEIDGVIISAPTVQDKIIGGQAVISGSFTVDEAKELARNLNAGALPVPVELVEQRSVGPSLGRIYVEKSIVAGFIGFLVVALFMILFYRLPGLLAVAALASYVIFSLFIFKIIPVTLTLAGIAGFVISMGMAVDANVLIFERFKEELRKKQELTVAQEEGFRGAWSSIRDSNISTLMSCLILYIFGTSFVRGFALTLGIGIVMSMLSAITITRVYLQLVAGPRWKGSYWWFGVKK